MSVVFAVLAVLLIAVGCALVGYGIPIKELGFDPTLLAAGSHVVVGGLLLLGLAAVLAELRRARISLKQQQSQGFTRAVRVAEMPPLQPNRPPLHEPAVVASAAAATVAHEAAAPEPAPVAREPVVVAKEPVPEFAREAATASGGLSVSADALPSAVGTSEIAIERLRSNVPRPGKSAQELEDAPLAPNGRAGASEPVPPQPPPHSQPQPRVDIAPQSSGVAAVEAREPRLDFLFRPRPPRPAPQPQEAFDSLWPTRPSRDRQPNPRLDVARAPAASSFSAPQAPRAATILKSGVVDGMAYTLYADGSIEAQLPQGTMRFSSIAELRTHIEANS